MEPADFLDAMTQRSSAPALIRVRDGVLQTLSYEELAGRVRALAGSLSQIGIVLVGAATSGQRSAKRLRQGTTLARYLVGLVV